MQLAAVDLIWSKSPIKQNKVKFLIVSIEAKFAECYQISADKSLYLRTASESAA